MTCIRIDWFIRDQDGIMAPQRQWLDRWRSGRRHHDPLLDDLLDDAVDGDNRNSYSTVTLPKFVTGDEIEYYFIVLKGDEVVAKSPKIYRARATEHCDAPYNRHALILTLECLPPSQNPMASSLAAAYATQITSPVPASPEKPQQ